MSDEEILDLDVFLPTARKRLWNALYQVHSVFANPFRVRLTIALWGAWPEFEQLISPIYGNRIRWVRHLQDGTMDQTSGQKAGYGCAKKWLWCLENLPWAEWFHLAADDDCILPWSFDHFMRERESDCGMVIGQCLPVSRTQHMDFSPYTLGRMVENRRIGMGSVFFNMRKLETLDRPYFDITTAYNDWELICKMARSFPFKIMRSTTSVVSLCERQDLPENFKQAIDDHNRISVA